MSEPERKRGVLMSLAVEGVIPVLGGCAGALAAGPGGGLVGVAVANVIEKAINYFGPPIVGRWAEWFRGQSPATQQAAISDLAELSPDECRREAESAVDHLAPDARPEDRSLAVAYLAAIPQAVQRSLVPDRVTGRRTLPPTFTDGDPVALLRLLPSDVPPYPAPGPLPDSEYRLEELVGTGGFGAVYRCSTPSLQYLPLAIKFCLNPSLLPALRQERSNLERLMKAGGEAWSPRVVRLYGYNLDHSTPYLVYEFVPGGNLAQWLAVRQGRGGLSHAEVLDLIAQVTEALAFAHSRGLVHRDLKPANVLFDGGAVKLADFGIGGVVAGHLARLSPSTASRSMTAAEQVSLYRGAGTPLYMSMEQRRGEAPDPRHDLYSLGVMWYQLLVGDVARELHPGWARELETRFGVSREHIGLIQQCVGWVEDRPRDAGELLAALQSLRATDPTAGMPSAPPSSLTAADSLSSGETSERYRQVLLITRMKQLVGCHVEVAGRQALVWAILQAFLVGLLLAIIVGCSLGVLTAEALRPRSPNQSPDTAEVMGGVVGVAVGLGLMGTVFLIRLRLWRKARALAEKALAAKLEQLQAEFPVEYRTWGGHSALAEAAIAEEVVRELEMSRGTR